MWMKRYYLLLDSLTYENGFNCAKPHRQIRDLMLVPQQCLTFQNGFSPRQHASQSPHLANFYGSCGPLASLALFSPTL